MKVGLISTGERSTHLPVVSIAARNFKRATIVRHFAKHFAMPMAQTLRPLRAGRPHAQISRSQHRGDRGEGNRSLPILIIIAAPQR